MATLREIIGGFEAERAERIEAALELMRAQAAGSLALRGRAAAILKEDRSPVTIADLIHQAQVQHMIAARFGGDGLVCEEPRELQEQVAEEAARVSGEVYGTAMPAALPEVPERGAITWMLDPIDGTKGYLAGRYYAIALGFFEGSRALFGAMAVPGAEEGGGRSIDARLAFGVAGRGAWIARLWGEGELEFEPLVTPAEEGGGSDRPLRVAVSLEHGGALAARLEADPTIETVKLDSQAKYLAVATGEIDAYLRQRRDDGGRDVTWDHMPGAVIAVEAGCAVRRFDGGAVDFAPEAALDYGAGIVTHRGAAGGAIGRRVASLVAG